MNRIIITGGTGFIGSKLKDRFLEKGYDVLVATRNSANQNLNSNLVSYSNIQYALTDGTIVINLAGANISKIPWCKKYKEEILESRVDTTNLICNCIENSGKNIKLIQASAIGYYGNRNDELLTETSKRGDDFLSEVCYQWENASKIISNSKKAIIRIGVVLDKSSGALPKLVLPFKFFSGNILGTGNQWLSWIHISDLIDSIEFIVDNDLSGTYNLVTDTLTMENFSNSIARKLHRPILFKIPEFLLKGILGESSQIFLNSQRVDATELKKNGFNYKYKNIEQALNDLLK